MFTFNTNMVCLNQNVLKVLKDNRELFLMWISCMKSLDPKVDPMHNPDWVEARKATEARKLDKLRRLHDAGYVIHNKL